MNIEIIRYVLVAVLVIALVIIFATCGQNYWPKGLDEHDGDRRLKQSPFDEEGNPRPAA